MDMIREATLDCAYKEQYSFDKFLNDSSLAIRNTNEVYSYYNLQTHVNRVTTFQNKLNNLDMFLTYPYTVGNKTFQSIQNSVMGSGNKYWMNDNLNMVIQSMLKEAYFLWLCREHMFRNGSKMKIPFRDHESKFMPRVFDDTQSYKFVKAKFNEIQRMIDNHGSFGNEIEMKKRIAIEISRDEEGDLHPDEIEEVTIG